MVNFLRDFGPVRNWAHPLTTPCPSDVRILNFRPPLHLLGPSPFWAFCRLPLHDSKELTSFQTKRCRFIPLPCFDCFHSIEFLSLQVWIGELILKEIHLDFDTRKQSSACLVNRPILVELLKPETMAFQMRYIMSPSLRIFYFVELWTLKNSCWRGFDVRKQWDFSLESTVYVPEARQFCFQKSHKRFSNEIFLGMKSAQPFILIVFCCLKF